MLKWMKGIYRVSILLGMLIIVLSAFCSNTKEVYYGSMSAQAELESFYSFQSMENIKRISYEIPKIVRDGDNLAVFTTDMEVWIEMSGSPVYSQTCGDGLFNRSTGSDWHFIHIQPSQAGETIDLYTRYAYPNVSKLMEREPEIRFGQVQEIYQHSSKIFSISRVVGLALIMLGTVFIIFSRTVARSAKNPDDHLNLTLIYLGIFSIALGVFTGTQYQYSSLFVGNHVLNTMIVGVPLVIMLPSFSFYVRELRRESETGKSWDIICAVNTIIAAVVLLLQLFDIFDLTQTRPIVHFGIYSSTIILIIITAIEIKRGIATKIVRIHLFPSLLCFIGAAADTVCYYIGTADSNIFGRLGFLILISYSGFTLFAAARRLMAQGRESELYKLLATSDSLTQLPNRTALVFSIAEAARDSVRNYGFFMMDINNLKLCNDTMGHKAGDEHLRKGAEIIKNAFKDCGEVYRIGGDEFVVMIRKPKSEIIAKCTGMLELEQTIYNEGAEEGFPIGIAWGYAEFSRELDSSYYDTITRADGHMYKMKKEMKCPAWMQAEPVAE